MKVNSHMINIISTYLETSESSPDKARLYDVIVSNKDYYKFLKEQESVIHMVSDIKSPKVPGAMFSDIANKIDGNNIPLNSVVRPSFKPWVIGGFAAIGISCAIIAGSFLSMKFMDNRPSRSSILHFSSILDARKPLGLDTEVINPSIDKSSSLDDRVTKNQKTDYNSFNGWLDGYNGIDRENIVDISANDREIRRNMDNILNLGYTGDLKEYISIEDKDISRVSTDYLAKAEKYLASGDTDKVNNMVYKAILSQHKVIPLAGYRRKDRSLKSS